MIAAIACRKISIARGQQKCVNQVGVDLKRVIYQCVRLLVGRSSHSEI